ncbi:hypothetical protein, partial [Microscilla marina]|uniref:hypothetical protein n=1 Tax=Microscilla marina TaxID=1027 RepID=UPI001E2C140F
CQPRSRYTSRVWCLEWHCSGHHAVRPSRRVVLELVAMRLNKHDKLLEALTQVVHNVSNGIAQVTLR